MAYKGEVSDWDCKLAKAERFLQKAHDHGKKVYSRYVDKREDNLTGTKLANFFYANTNTLKESLFNSLPTPEVGRLQKGDFQDDVARVGALIVQRALTYEVECMVSFEEAVSSAIIDRLVPGVGQTWVSFHNNPEQTRIEHVKWDDFGFEPQRLWSKVGWVYRKLYLTTKEVKNVYGKKATFVGLDDDSTGTALFSGKHSENMDDLTPKELIEDRHTIYEIWDKSTKKVYHVYRGQKEPLLELDDPLKLIGFFPCPRPMIANAVPSSLLPITDYHIAQDQYLQLDKLYARINLIIQAIKAAGLYNAENSGVASLLSAEDNIMIPVSDWAMHAEAGGTNGQVDWYPVEKVAMVLQELYKAFEGTKTILYEITGMSDILRGASSPYETKGAQEIKAQFASVRMNGYQREVARFVRDNLRIIAEVVCQLYSDEKVAAIVGDLPENDRQYAPAAMQMLRDDLMMKYKVGIQANSLTQADWALEKEQKVEVVQTIGGMISQIAEIATKSPQMTILGVQLVKFALTGFKSAVELESWIDGELDKLSRQQLEAEKNPQPPEPTPEEKKAEAEIQKIQLETQAKEREAELKSQMEQQKMVFEQQMQQQKLMFEQKMGELKLMLQQALAQGKLQESQMNMQVKQQEAALNMETQQQEAALNMETQQQQAAMTLEQQEESFEQKSRFADEDQARKAAQPKKNEE